MAKQNVGFGERHLEKLVAGVAGAVLLATLFLYVVQDPFSVEIAGTSVGPGSFYPELDEKANSAMASLKNAPPREPDEWKPPTIPGQRSGPTDLPVVFAQVHPPVPQLDSDIDVGIKHDLVDILPPGKPAATVGRAYCALPPSEVRLVGEQQNPPATGDTSPADYHWAAVFASVDRRGQQRAFMDGGYAVDRQVLIVTNVEAERQRLLPDGQWGPTEKVLDFNPSRLVGRHTVALGEQGGDPFIDPEDYKFIEEFKKAAIEKQPDILRPPFQDALPQEAQLDWAVPQAMPDGTTFDWVEVFGVMIPAPDEAAGGPGEAGAAAARFDYRKAKAEIDALVGQGKYIDAADKIDQILASSRNLPPPQKTELEQLRNQLERPISEELERREAERVRREELEEAILGPETDLLWVTDPTAVPGETYRYRVRLLALNPHAGLIRKLRNPEDAAKVVLAGEWSDWSDPVSVKPAKYLFCTTAEPDGSAKIELHQWANGEWDRTNQSMSLGQAVSFQDKLKDFSYDAVLAGVNPSGQYQERTSDHRGIRYRDPRDTMAVLFVRGDGEVEEHLLLEDLGQRRELNSELTARKDAPVRRAISPRNRATPDRRSAPPRSNRGDFDERRR